MKVVRSYCDNPQYLLIIYGSVENSKLIIFIFCMYIYL